MRPCRPTLCRAGTERRNTVGLVTAVPRNVTVLLVPLFLGCVHTCPPGHDWCVYHLGLVRGPVYRGRSRDRGFPSRSWRWLSCSRARSGAPPVAAPTLPDDTWAQPGRARGWRRRRPRLPATTLPDNCWPRSAALTSGDDAGDNAERATGRGVGVEWVRAGIQTAARCGTTTICCNWIMPEEQKPLGSCTCRP